MKNSKLYYNFFLITLLLNQKSITAQSNAVLLNFAVNMYNIDRFNISEQYGTYLYGTGFNIGFAFEKHILKSTSVMLGFEFSNRKYDNTIWKLENAVEDNYISFPISINYYLIKNFAIQVGIQFDHLIFKQKFIYYKDAPNDQISGYTKYDIGLNTGLRFQFYNFELNGTFNLGLRNIYCLKYLDPVTGDLLDDFVKSHLFKFGISYLFK